MKSFVLFFTIVAIFIPSLHSSAEESYHEFGTTNYFDTSKEMRTFQLQTQEFDPSEYTSAQDENQKIEKTLIEKGVALTTSLDSATSPSLSIAPIAASDLTAKYLLKKLTDFHSPDQLTDKDVQCVKAYQSLYANDVIKISIYWGYLDFELETHDQQFKNATIANLTTPCELARFQSVCGFQYDAVEKNSLFKMIQTPEGKNKKILIKVLSSSYSTQTFTNEQEKVGKDLQQKLTEQRWQEFERSLQQDTVVLYIGHSRYGSGPDFGPLNPYSYNAIRSNFSKPNLARMKSALASTSTPPKVLGMITCQAKSYYAKILNDVAPATSLILTNQSTAFADNLPTVLATLESLIGTKCEEGFIESYKKATSFYSTHKYDVSTYRQKSTKIIGFFDKHEKYKDPAKLSPYLMVNEYLVPAPQEEEKLDEFVNQKPSLLLTIPYLRHN